MARKIIPAAVRLNNFTTWPNLWHTERNYTKFWLSDVLIKLYLKFQFKLYGFELVGFEVKHSLSMTFIKLLIFNGTKQPNFQFKNINLPKKPYFIELVLKNEIRRFNFVLSRLLGVHNIRFLIRYPLEYKPTLRYVVLYSNPILLANFFIKNYLKPNSGKFLVKKLAKATQSIIDYNDLNLRGLKLTLVGPMRAPRTRRSQIIKKSFFGAVPIQSFSANILFAAKSRVLKEGVITAKFWFYNKVSTKFSNRKRILNYIEQIMLAYYVDGIARERKRLQKKFGYGRRAW